MSQDKKKKKIAVELTKDAMLMQQFKVTSLYNA